MTENNIHKTAIIDSTAQLGSGVKVGPYSVLGPGVVAGDNVWIANHCVVEGNTTIGSDCRIFSGAVVGSLPQDKRHQEGDDVSLTIGSDNTIREYVTINPGTVNGGGKTVIGNGNLFMAYSHIAHDCHIGNNCVTANCGTLAGHVTLEDNSVLGGLSAVHQFVRLGRLSIIGGCSKVVQDIPPFSTCDGHPAKVFGLNMVGLRRAKFPLQTVKILKQAFKILFHSGFSKTHAIERIEKELEMIPEIEQLVAFVKETKRGLCS